MRLLTCGFGLILLLATGLSAASGFASASDDPIDLGKASAGPRPAHQGFDLPVTADTLLATTAGDLSPGLKADHAGMLPVAARSNSTSLAAAVSGVPARVTIAPMNVNAATGLQATVSIALTSTSMTDAAGQAAALPNTSGIVSVDYSIR
ncbi:hypothetical protein [Telluria beijingensis]|uniref:hypothetical protein n=1 Tax=Telluria beijingensis TaxID=3068633 RepID=UPI002795F0E6|nr:hypothetical protein [Massilia sp. REN29]